ncbi:hypothetical protein [Nostoc sp. FACHB-110]|uniref:hypothetical protein n=1 Tax=Nostoc sp. FACHB-110 TaxID=2692834 RepID=UPI0016851DA5|nr:hypothetical protein [Nostoc sp. FACHB-110]MBD2437044.1 hypothetical protein [Nostoc sp. FACHB-110]
MHLAPANRIRTPDASSRALPAQRTGSAIQTKSAYRACAALGAPRGLTQYQGFGTRAGGEGVAVLAVPVDCEPPNPLAQR